MKQASRDEAFLRGLNISYSSKFDDSQWFGPQINAASDHLREF